MHLNKDASIISHLRKNARESITKIGRETNTPVSTVFDRLKNYEKNIITKHTCLLDFKTLGYETRTHIMLKAKSSKREEIKTFIENHPNINNASRLNNGEDYLLEAYFENIEALQRFNEEAQKTGAKDIQEHFIIEEIKREGMTPEHNKTVGKYTR